MSLTWENIGDTTANWKYGIITGTGTLTSTIVDSLLNTTDINLVFDLIWCFFLKFIHTLGT